MTCEECGRPLSIYNLDTRCAGCTTGKPMPSLTVEGVTKKRPRGPRPGELAAKQPVKHDVARCAGCDAPRSGPQAYDGKCVACRGTVAYRAKPRQRCENCGEVRVGRPSQDGKCVRCRNRHRIEERQRRSA